MVNIYAVVNEFEMYEKIIHYKNIIKLDCFITLFRNFISDLFV